MWQCRWLPPASNKKLEERRREQGTAGREQGTAGRELLATFTSTSNSSAAKFAKSDVEERPGIGELNVND